MKYGLVFGDYPLFYCTIRNDTDVPVICPFESDNKRVESEMIAIFPVEVTKTCFTTNCDDSKKCVQLMQNLQYLLFKNQIKKLSVPFSVQSHV